jgi:peptide/nickel transport system permease protein
VSRRALAVELRRPRIRLFPESRVWSRLARNHLALLSAILLFVVIAISLLAPVLPIRDPDMPNTTLRMVAPGQGGHLLGTDSLGRDLLSRIIWGGRISLTAGIMASTLALLGGVVLGVLAGFVGGRLDSVLMRTVDVVMAFPVILLAMAIVAALGPSLTNAMLAAAVAGIPLYARVARAQVLTLRELDFVLAARAMGVPVRRIMVEHILPNILTPLIVTYTLDIGNMIILTSSLSFLGLGAQPPTADWGNMIASGRSHIRSVPHLVLIPGVAIFLVVLAFNLLGDGLRDATDPRMEK